MPFLRTHRHRLFVSLWFIAGLVQCQRPGIGGQPSDRTKQPIAEAMGEGKCREVPEYATPLVLDWRSHDRAALEDAMNDGVVAVKYDCNTIEIVRGCAIGGEYGFIGVQRKEDVLQLADADEIRANLPTFGAELSAEMQRGSALDVAYVTVGKRRTPLNAVARTQLGGSCSSATHFVRGVYVGAFAMRRGTAGKLRGAVEVLGFGLRGGTESSSERVARDGDSKACAVPAIGREAPPENCGSLLRLELVAVDADDKPPEMDVAQCPAGMVMRQGKCSHAVRGIPHQCDPKQPSQCATQCDKGDAPSCALHAFNLHYGYNGVTKDVARARELYESSCASKVQHACAGLGILYSRGEAGVKRDFDKANALSRKACDAGVPRGCNNLGVSHEKGQGVPVDQATATKLYERGCSGGLAFACVNLGISHLNGRGVPRDPARARVLFEQGCDAEPENCVQLAHLYARGTEVPQDWARAAMLYRKACDGARSDRGNEACKELAWSYILGRGVTKDVGQGMRRLKTACDDGHPRACLDKAIIHFRGEHVEKNELKGNGILETACRRGVGDACSDLGYSYEIGQGVAKDMARASQYYDRACELESGIGCVNRGKMNPRLTLQERDNAFERSCTLGFAEGCYRHGLVLRRTGKTEESRSVIERACGDRYGDACTWLASNHPDPARRVGFAEVACDVKPGLTCSTAGKVHEYGTGVPASHLKAAEYYDRACKAGHGPGCTSLARLYESSPDLPRDTARATALHKQRCISEASKSSFWSCKPEWVEEICSDLERCAQYAWRLAKGTHGQKADPKLALTLWKRACDGQHYNGCWGLAEAHEFGWGVPKSKSLAKKHFKQACDRGADPERCRARLSAKP